MGVIGVSALAVIMSGGLAAPVAAAATGTATATAGTAAAATTGSAIAVSGTAAATQTGTIIASGTIAASGPLAWLIVGAEPNNAITAQITLDCWKPLLHNDSIEPSQGKRLKDLIEDRLIKKAYLVNTAPLINGIPLIKLVNAWDEEFEVKYSFTHPLTGEAVLHATKI